MAVTYEFYTTTYLGGSIPDAEFPRLAARAAAKLEQYKRMYTVTALETDTDGTDESMAICSMADALYYFETVQNVPQSASIGSVSSNRGVGVDVSPKAQAAELYRCASLYLDIYRGVETC